MIPERSHTVRAMAGSLVVAQRYTVWPSWANRAGSPSIRTAPPISGTEPHSTGPIPGSGAAPITAAPAPSPTSTQVERSVQSTTSVNFSAPMTRAWVAEPARMAWSAVASAWVKPEQTTLRSIVAGAARPSRAATRAAVFGLRSWAVQVATSTRSMSCGARPLAARALAAAAAAIESTVSSGAATWRVRMPTRLRIQASSVSTILARSSLVSTPEGW